MKKKDTRILHVSYLHQQYENENVAELLAQKVDLFKMSGYIEDDDNCIRLTEKGFLMSNTIIANLV